MKLEGYTYPDSEDAVEGVDHVQRNGQCHVTTPLDPLDQGADTGDSVGRTIRERKMISRKINISYHVYFYLEQVVKFRLNYVFFFKFKLELLLI